MDGEEKKFSEQLKSIFMEMRQAEERKKELREVQRLMKLENDKLQSLKNAVHDKTIQLKEQRRIITNLECEERQVIFNINLLNNDILQKRKLLENEKCELEKRKSEFFAQCVAYCNNISEFVATNSLKTNNAVLENSVKQRNSDEILQGTRWTSTVGLKKTEVETLKNKVNDLKTKILEKKQVKEEMNQRLFHERLKKAIETEELRYEKLLEERQSEMKQLTYQIKLKKLQKNRESVVNATAPLIQKLSTASTKSNVNDSGVSAAAKLLSESEPLHSSKRTLNYPVDANLKRRTQKSQLKNFFNPRRFINATRNHEL